MRITTIAIFAGAALIAFSSARSARALSISTWCGTHSGDSQWPQNEVTCQADSHCGYDQRQIPCIVNNNPGYYKAEIVPIFWDSNPSYWNAPSGGMSRGQTMGQLQYIVNSAYLGALTQYDVSPPRLAPVAPIDSSLPLSSYSPTWTNQCPNNNGCGTYYAMYEVNNAIAAGLVPPPTHGAEMLYVVVTPPGLTGGYLTGTCPFTDAAGTHSCGSWDTNPPTAYRFAYANADDPLGLTHEIVEALAYQTTTNNSTPMVYGCTFTNNSSNVPTSIADLCMCGPDNGTTNNAGPDNEQQNGYWLPAYYSKFDNSCVIPEGWAGLWAYSSASSWRYLNNTSVRQIATSGPNIVITDNGDNIYSYTDGVSTRWTWMGNRPGVLAISGTTTSAQVVSLAVDGSNISRSPINSNSWSSLGLPAAFASSIISGVSTFATDAKGQPYYWNNGYWQNIGGPGDQFVGTAAEGNAIFGLNWDHGGVNYRVPSTSGSWYGAAGPSTALFGNPASDLVAITDSNFNIWAYSYYWGTLLKQGSPGDSWAVNGGPYANDGTYNLWALNLTRLDQFDDFQPLLNGGDWSQITTGNLGRIVGASYAGGNNTMYAFGCVGSAGTCVNY